MHSAAASSVPACQTHTVLVISATAAGWADNGARGFGKELPGVAGDEE